MLALNRPSRHNALTPGLMDQLVDQVLDAGEDPRTHVVVIRGEGQSFSAGYDLSGGSYTTRTPEENVAHLRAISRRWEAIYHCAVPVIAQVHGHCLAGGTDLVGHCDLVMVADESTIGFPAVRSMGVALTQMWIYNVGPQWAKRLLLTGDTMSGKVAAELGFALASVPQERLAAETMALARRVALVERQMLIGNKRVVNRGIDLMGREALQDYAAEQDAAAHLTFSARRFAERAREAGLSAAVDERDAPFGPSRLDLPDLRVGPAQPPQATTENPRAT